MRVGPFGLALLVLMSGCGRHYYPVSNLDGIVEIDVRHEYPAFGRIIDRKRVAAIVAFMNARRDRWYDPGDKIFALSGELTFLGPHNKRFASVFIGPGGMMLSRPGRTYHNDMGELRELQLDRTPWPAEAEEDEATLCALIGTENARYACNFVLPTPVPTGR